MVVTLGQQYNVGEKPIILYTYINRHAGKPDKIKKQNRYNVVHPNMVVIIYCYIVCKDKTSMYMVFKRVPQ